ncbi:MAG: OmpA family protein [Verrucomicrobiota bacterium]
MKSTAIFNVVILGLILSLGAAGCKKKPIGITNIPNQNIGITGKSNGELDPGNALAAPANPNFDPNFKPGVTTDLSQADHPTDFDKRVKNTEMFAADVVYFDTDSSAVKASQKSKLESVASGFKSQAAGDLLIEGHCDERGTEGYNLTLGDKRANALREYLVNLGVSAEKIHTVSFGESKPAVVGMDESAFSKNRRGEFVFVEPAK